MFSIKGIPPILSWLNRVVSFEWRAMGVGCGAHSVTSLFKEACLQGLVLNEWMQTNFKHKIKLLLPIYFALQTIESKKSL